MKKLIVLIAALLAAMFVVGCATKGPTGPTAADMIADAKSGAPMGSLIGTATSQGTKDASARSKAEQNAVNKIKMALSYIVSELVDAQVTSGRVSSSDASGIKQTVATVIDRTAVTGVKKVDSGADASFRAWAVYSLDKASALQSITSAVTTAKDAVSVGNFNPNNGFDDVFAKAAAREWK